MSTVLFDALAAIADRLAELASSDAELRSRVRRLAEVLLEATGVDESTEESATRPANATTTAANEPEVRLQLTQAPAEVEPSATAAVRVVEPPERIPLKDLPELTLGRGNPLTESIPSMSLPRWTTPDESDLLLIESRCRLKAEGTRWAVKRRRLLAEGADHATAVAPFDKQIIARAKELPDCFLWMCHPTGPDPSDADRFEDVAGCFENTADSLAVVRKFLAESTDGPPRLEEPLSLLAESQSALRQALGGIGWQNDTDQSQVFNWLKAVTSERQVFIRRHMRMDDAADPTVWSERSGRIAALDLSLQEAGKSARRRRKLLGKVKHKLSLIVNDPSLGEVHWPDVAGNIETLVNDGLPPSNVELREMLIPTIDTLPELADFPLGFQQAIREVDRYLANAPDHDEAEAYPVAGPNPEVLEVAELLHGKSMVLIGGERRPASHRALEQAFRLGELIWIETREHQSIDGFEPYVARPEVAVVVLAIRWSSHSFGEVRDFCERHGKPLVRLPAGYNPNQVAKRILDQCGERLRRD